MATPAKERIVLVGGPHDGEHLTIPAGRDVWLMMPPEDPADFWRTPTLGHPPQPLNYRVLLDPTGHPSRTDTGELVYELDVPGVSSHYRCRVWVDHETYGWPALVFCRCGVALAIPDQRALDDFQVRHFLDPAYGRETAAKHHPASPPR